MYHFHWSLSSDQLKTGSEAWTATIVLLVTRNNRWAKVTLIEISPVYHAPQVSGDVARRAVPLGKLTFDGLHMRNHTRVQIRIEGKLIQGACRPKRPAGQKDKSPCSCHRKSFTGGLFLPNWLQWTVKSANFPSENILCHLILLF